MDDNAYLTSKEIANRLRKHISYVYAMRRAGFQMPGRVAQFRAVIIWLRKNPSPRAKTREDAHLRTL